MSVLVGELGFLHFTPEVVALGGALADAAEHGVAAELTGDTRDHLLDDDGLADTGAAEQSDLAAANEGAEEVDDLDAGDEDFCLGVELVEVGGLAVDGEEALGAVGPTVVDGLAQEVEDPAEDFFYIESGHVELSLISPDGQKKTVEVIGHDRTFAEAIVFMQTGKFPVTAEALTDSVVYRIPNRSYRALLQDNCDACMRLLSDVCRHLHQRVQEIERLTIQNARSRLSSYLIDHIVETNDDEATVRLDLPKHVIASRLSITPETLSRLLRAMSDDGILTVDDRLVFVHSLARLRPYD